MSVHYLDHIVEQLRALDDYGTQRLDNGTFLIRENINRKPGQLRYWHIVYGALNDEQIAHLEVRIQRKMPSSLRDLYRHANGGIFFLKSFSWHGLREDYSRDPGKWLPISLEYGNTIGRPLEGPSGQERFADNSNQLRFGIYVEADAEVMMQVDGDCKVYAVPRYKLGPVLYEWPDVETFFVSEIERMLGRYRGRDLEADGLTPFPPPWF
jgi:hypothetical protein